MVLIERPTSGWHRRHDCDWFVVSEQGYLEVFDTDGQRVLTYAPGAWHAAEIIDESEEEPEEEAADAEV